MQQSDIPITSSGQQALLSLLIEEHKEVMRLWQLIEDQFTFTVIHS
jgi:hypothetical protein